MIKFDKISAYSVFLLSNITRCYLDKNMTDEELKIDIEMNFRVFYNIVGGQNPLINFKDLTLRDTLDLGFYLYTEADKDVKNGHVMLVPLYLLPALPEGIELYCVTTKKYVTYNGIDSLDVSYRVPFIKYGIVVKRKRGLFARIKTFSKLKKASVAVNVLGLLCALLGVFVLFKANDIKAAMWAASCTVLWCTILFDSISE